MSHLFGWTTSTWETGRILLFSFTSEVLTFTRDSDCVYFGRLTSYFEGFLAISFFGEDSVEGILKLFRLYQPANTVRKNSFSLN